MFDILAGDEIILVKRHYERLLQTSCELQRYIVLFVRSVKERTEIICKSSEERVEEAISRREEKLEGR